MNERLQQFLSAENLTSAKLADILGVQRSGLSHILSGRNYPSYEFIRTILSKFPNLSADWLLLGKGKMYKDAGSPASPPVPSPSPASAASSEPAPLMNPVDEDPSLFDQQESLVAEEDAPSYRNSVRTVPEKPVTKKEIVRITVFYADGSYEEH
jgi:transcriptional regulator with XRE-family HTH domain